MLHFIVSRSVWQAGMPSYAMATADGRGDVTNVHKTEVTYEVGICKGFSTVLYETLSFTSFYYFLLLYTPALQRGNKKWQLLRFG